MRRFYLAVVIFMVCAGVMPLAAEGLSQSGEYKDLFAEPPQDGLPFDSIDTIDENELAELVREVTEYHYDFSCTEFDTIPLMAPDGEYRALAVLFSVDPELEDTHEALLEMHKSQLEAESKSEELRNTDLGASEDYFYQAHNHRTNIASYYTFMVGSINGTLMPIGVHNHNIFLSTDESAEAVDKKYIFTNYCIIPNIYETDPSAFNYDITRRYKYLDNIVWTDSFIPEDIINNYGWLYYIESDWREWHIPRNALDKTLND